MLIGGFLPAFYTFKALRNGDSAILEQQYWLKYWGIASILSCVEYYADIFIFWLPFYYELKVIIILWLVYSKGAEILFQSHVEPNMEKHEEKIDSLLTHAKRKGVDVVVKGTSYAFLWSQKMLTQSLIEGTRYIASQTKRKQDYPEPKIVEKRNIVEIEKKETVLIEKKEPVIETVLNEKKEPTIIKKKAAAESEELEKNNSLSEAKDDENIEEEEPEGDEVEDTEEQKPSEEEIPKEIKKKSSIPKKKISSKEKDQPVTLTRTRSRTLTPATTSSVTAQKRKQVSTVGRKAGNEISRPTAPPVTRERSKTVS